MATGWVKVLQCKSNAMEDVCRQPPPPLPFPASPRRQKPPLIPLSCGNTSHALKDVVFHFPRKHHPPPPPPPPPPEQKKDQFHQSRSARRGKNPKPKATRRPPPSIKSPSPSPARPNTSPFPTLTELPPGHSSRRVVEIIFSSSWSGRPGEPFPGEIEMLFKVHQPAREVARFEEYRDVVRFRAGREGGDARCAADGNEMMRFHSAPAGPSTTASGEPIYDAGVMCTSPRSAGGGGIHTFSGSGGAHRSVGGGGGGRRRAMLVCRVIAGRVRSGIEPGLGQYESVSIGRGELLVLDPRAVLPCFLIIYKI